MVLVVKQHRCTHSASCVCTKGHLSEDALFLVFRHMNWNPRLIAILSCVCKWFDEVAKQVLWKEFCHARAPKMMLDLHSGGSHIVDGNWKALGKLLIYCNGCTKGGLFNNIHVPGHFVFRTRFSRTAGKSFLPLPCKSDVLYVSDPCEHLDQGEEGDLGFFRGIFKSFATSRVKKMLIETPSASSPSPLPDLIHIALPPDHPAGTDRSMASAAVVDAGDAPEPTVQNLLDQDTLKWVFVGGKGGVGKTTCSSILSVLLASVRQSVLVISTDPAHNLSDAFQQRFTKFPTLVRGFTNLYAMEIDPKVENDDLSNEGMEGFLSELTNAIPGVDEAMSFAEMLKLVQTMDYSVVVFDTAPTGHTLRLLQFPATLEKGLEKMMELKNRFGGLLNQASRLFGLGDELNEDAMLGRLEGMKDVIEQVNRQFKDPDLTTFVCVCIPEFLSLYETERLVQELAKFEIDSHNIIINQVIFDEEPVESKLLKARVKMQQKYIDQFHMLYDDFNITKLPLLSEEVCGVQALQNFSRHFLTPYKSAIKRGTVEELEQRISILKSALQEAESELDRVRKGKQSA